MVLTGTIGWGRGKQGRQAGAFWQLTWGSSSVSGHRAVWPPPDGAAEALPVALPVFQ